jgi:hypothetical protein
LGQVAPRRICVEGGVTSWQTRLLSASMQAGTFHVCPGVWMPAGVYCASVTFAEALPVPHVSAGVICGMPGWSMKLLNASTISGWFVACAMVVMKSCAVALL